MGGGDPAAGPARSSAASLPEVLALGRGRGEFGIPTLATRAARRARWGLWATRPSRPRSRSRRVGVHNTNAYTSYIYTLNDSPQPHRPFSFGFVNVKPVSKADSSKSMTVPTMWNRAGGSTQTVAPSASTFSWSLGGGSSA